MYRSVKYPLAALLLASAAMIASAGAYAQQVPAASGSSLASVKIATVGVQNIMRDSTAAKSIHEQLDSKQRAFQAELTKKEDALRKEEQELAKQRGSLSKEAFEQKVKAFQERVTTNQKEVETKKMTLDSAYERAVAQIQKSVTDIIGELAKERGFAVAMPSSQILYADPSLDITADVLSRLNQRLPRVDVRFESPSKQQ